MEQIQVGGNKAMVISTTPGLMRGPVSGFRALMQVQGSDAAKVSVDVHSS